MWIQFLLQNVHFSTSLLAALIFFAVFWLYLDSWSTTKTPTGLFKIVGFVLLSLSYFTHSLSVETSPSTVIFWLTIVPRLLGLTLITLDLLAHPLQSHPIFILLSTPLIVTPTTVLSLISPLFFLGVSFLYLRRATIGLERHLTPLFIGFFVLTSAETLSLSALFRSTVNPLIFSLTAPFGPLWLGEHVLLILACVIFGRWVVGYLTKRLMSQLFMTFTLITLIVFLATTVSFTSLLLKNFQDQALAQLTTDAQVLSFSLENKKQETLATAQLLAQNPTVISLLSSTPSATAKHQLQLLAQNHLLTKNSSFLIIVNSQGQVVAKGEDQEKTGDLSTDTLVIRALAGETVSSPTTSDGPTAPIVSLRAAVPITTPGHQTLGVVLAGIAIDSAFLDGIKNATGLAASVYAKNVISATTLVAPDGVSRPLGLTETDSAINTTVLMQAHPYSGPVSLLNTPYFSSFLPILDLDSSPVGMLAILLPQTDTFALAARSIQLTFITTAILLLFFILPSYLISRYLSNQLK